MKRLKEKIPIEYLNKVRKIFLEKHRIPDSDKMFFERNDYGFVAENEKNLEVAIKFYEQNVSEFPSIDFPFKRLMVIYRKLKRFDEELRIIDAFLDSHKNSSRKAEMKKIAERRNKVASLLKRGLNNENCKEA